MKRFFFSFLSFFFVWCEGNLQLPYLSFLFHNSKYQERDRVDIKHFQHEAKCFWQFTVCSIMLYVERRFFLLYSLGWFNKTGKKTFPIFCLSSNCLKVPSSFLVCKERNCMYWEGILCVAVVPLILPSSHNTWCFPDSKTTMTNLISRTSSKVQVNLFRPILKSQKWSQKVQNTYKYVLWWNTFILTN